MQHFGRTQIAVGKDALIWGAFPIFTLLGGRPQYGKVPACRGRALAGSRALQPYSQRTKSGKSREIPITKGARIALDKLPKDGEHAMPRMAPASLSRACIHDIRRAKLDGSLHTLRHTFISQMVMAGVPLCTVQKLAGHSTVAVTERYSHLAPRHLLDAGRAISLDCPSTDQNCPKTAFLVRLYAPVCACS